MGTTLTDLTWEDVEEWATANNVGWDAATVIEMCCRQRREVDERWEAAKMVIAGDLSYFYQNTGHEWLEPRWLIVNLAYLFDLAQSEGDGPTMNVERVRHASRTSTPYSTVNQIDAAYTELGRALETWKASL